MAELPQDESPWENRGTDEASLPYTTFAGIGTGLFAGAGGALLASLLGADISIREMIASALFAGGLTLGVVVLILNYAHVIDWSGLGNWTVVPPGHRAAVTFRGTYTGEVAGPGLLVVPLQYGWNSFDCRSQPYSIGPQTVRSADGFAISASIRANVRTSNLFKNMEVANDRSTIEPLMTSTLHSAVSTYPALKIIEDRESINASALKQLSVDLSRYGLEAEYAYVDVTTVPEHLSPLTASLATLRAAMPGVPVSQLIELVMAHAGTLTINHTSNRHEIVGLQDLVDLAARRFGTGK